MLLVLALAMSQASAAVFTFTDRSAWQAAAGGGVGDLTEDFNGVGADLIYDQGASQTVGPLTFSFSGTSALARVDTSPSVLSGEFAIDATPYAFLRSLDSAGTTVSFAAATAIGFDYNTGSTTLDIMEGMTSAGDTFTLPNTGNTQGFFGIVSTTAFTSFVTSQDFVNPEAGVLGTDNWEIFSASVPAAPTGLLILGALLLVRSYRRL